MQVALFTYISIGNAQVQGIIASLDIPAQGKFLKKEEFEGGGIHARENLTRGVNHTGNRSLLGLQGSAYYSHSDQSRKSDWKHGCGEFSQADHSENLALIPLSKLELDGVASLLCFLQVQGPARYQCSTRVFALVQNEHKNSHMLLLPWVLEHKDLSIGFQFQLSIILDDWRLIVRSVRLAVHVFALPLAKRCQNRHSLHSAISLDGLLFLIQSVLNYMDYWWSTTAILTEIASISSAGFSMQLCGTSFSIDHGGTTFLSSFLHENGLARYIFRPCALAFMMNSRVFFQCALTSRRRARGAVVDYFSVCPAITWASIFPATSIFQTYQVSVDIISLVRRSFKSQRQ